MAYFSNGFLFRSQPDWNALAEIFPPSVSLVGLRHRASGLFLLDAWTAVSHRHFPFTDPLHEFVEARVSYAGIETVELRERLSRVVDAIQDDTGAIYGDLLIGFTADVSSAARVETLFFASDDESADMACIAKAGRVLRFQLAAGFYEISYRDGGAIEVFPRRFVEETGEAEDDGYSQKALDRIAGMRGVVVRDPVTIKGGEQLQSALLRLWPQESGDPETVFAIGTFDAFQNVERDADVVFEREAESVDEEEDEDYAVSSKEPISGELLRERWDSPPFRYRLTVDILDLVRDYSPLAEALPVVDAVRDLIDDRFARQLYRVLEYRSGQHPSRWRKELAALLPEHESAFPSDQALPDPKGLFAAIERNDEAQMKRILAAASQYGWDLELHDEESDEEDGSTPLDRARKLRRERMVDMLEQYEADHDFGSLRETPFDELSSLTTPRALYELGRRYLGGEEGAPHDPGLALQYFERAAAEDYGAAIFMVGVMHNEAEGVPRNRKRARRFMSDAAMMGNLLAQKELATLLFELEETEEGMAWLQIAAGEGDGEAAHRLATIYREGKLVPADDEEWLAWLKHGFANDYTPAIVDLARAFQDGRGVEKNETEALELLTIAAVEGDLDGMFTLGCAYEEGRGVTPDMTVALHWFDAMGEEGDPRGWYRIGTQKWVGTDGDADPEGAREWFEKAAATGDARSCWALATLLMELPDSGEAEYRRAASLLRQAAADGMAKAACDLAKVWLNEESRAKFRVADDAPPEERFPRSDKEARRLLREASDLGDREARSLLRQMPLPQKSEGGMVAKIRAAAESGDAEAQYQLGQMRERADGMRRDISEAISWYEKAAANGQVDAALALGRIHINGTGVKKSYEMARRWYLLAAEQGSLRGVFHVGYCDDRLERYESALEWYRKAAEGGDLAAAFNLAQLYRLGQGAEKNFAAAEKWFRVAAREGDGEALRELGLLLLREAGDGGSAEGMEFLRRAATGGDTAAQYHLAQWLVDDDPRAAAEWLRKAAVDDVRAQSALGMMLVEGDEIEQNVEEGMTFLRKAAKAGHVDSQMLLGVAYREGVIVPRDLEKSELWFSRAIEQDHGRAMVMLGRMLLEDESEESDRRAVELFRRASMIDPVAALMLGFCYEDGRGVAIDREEGRSWIDAAKNADDPLVEKLLAERD
jgi:TPR repeat protein